MNFARQKEVSLLDLVSKTVLNMKQNNKSTQRSRLFTLNDTVNQPIEKELLQEYSLLTKRATELISKRVFSLKATCKAIKSQAHPSTVDLQDLKGMNLEVKMLESVCNHIRNKTINMVDFDAFKPYMHTDEISNIYTVVKNLVEFHKEKIVKSNIKTNVGSIEDLCRDIGQNKSGNALQLIFKDMIKPRLNSEIRSEVAKQLIQIRKEKNK